jgi:iron complex outermembrane receptor protein
MGETKMTTRHGGLVLLTTSALALVLGAPAARAETAADAPPTTQQGPTTTQLEAVVVTARRREENLQEVPVAVTALPASTFDKAGAFNAQDLMHLAPSLGVTASVGNRDVLIFSIRGQGQTFGTVFPSVIPYFAEVPLQRLTTGFFYDLDNVQVLRGPQGTLFGRNTDGGAILLQPQRPTNTFSGYGEVKLGDYNLQEFKGALNLPIVEDKVLFRAAFDIARRDGFTENLTTGSDLDNTHYNSFRTSLILRPFEHLENDTVFAYYDANEHGSGPKLSFANTALLGAIFKSFGFPPATVNGILATATADVAEQNAIGPRKTRLSMQPFSKRQTYFLSNTTTYNVTADLLIKNTFGYVHQKERVGADFDGSTLALVDTIAEVPNFRTEQYTDELQFQGNSFDSKLKWVAGLYYDQSKPGGFVDPTSVIELLVLRVKEPTQNTSESKAVFAQGTYDLGSWVSGLKFTAGARYTEDRITELASQFLNAGCQAGFPPPTCTLSLGPTKFNATTWTLALDYQLDPDTLVYVSAHRGYKTGGFNVTFPSAAQALYQPEYLTDQEIGLKKDWRWGDVQARLNADVYHGSYTGSQKVVSTAVNGQAFTFVANVPKATVQGVEVEGTLIPLRNLVMNLNYAYTDAHFDQGLPSFPVSTRFGGTPKNQVDLAVHYTFDLGSPGSIQVGGDWYYQSTMALIDTDGITVGGDERPYSLLNLDATWKNVAGRNIDLSAFVTNATDKVYRAGTANITNSLGIAANLYGPPRMFGVSLKYRFGGPS